MLVKLYSQTFVSKSEIEKIQQIVAISVDNNETVSLKIESLETGPSLLEVYYWNRPKLLDDLDIARLIKNELGELPYKCMPLSDVFIIKRQTGYCTRA